MERDAIIKRTEVMSAPVERELVILNPARDDYVALDPIGRRIWELLETPRKLEEVCRRLGDEFTGEPAQIAADVVAFLEELRDEGLIDVGDTRSA